MKASETLFDARRRWDELDRADRICVIVASPILVPVALAGVIGGAIIAGLLAGMHVLGGLFGE